MLGKNTATTAPAAPAVTPVALQRILMVIIALTALAVFSGSFRAAFVHWDDNINIYDNAHLKQGLSLEGLRWMFTDAQYIPRYMPLGWLSYAVSYEISRLEPAGFHLGNLLLHAANSMLVFLLLHRLLRLMRDRLNPAAKPESLLYCAALGAMLWAIHPLRVESVAWASARIYNQALLLLLISVLSYLKSHAADTTPRAQRVLFWLSVSAFLCSLLTYPLALGFLAVLVVIDWCLLKRFTSGLSGLWNAQARGVWLEKIPFCLAAATVLGLTLAARLSSPVWSGPPSLEVFTLAQRGAQAFYIWGYYLWKHVVPLNLAPTYSTLTTFDPWSLPFLLSVALVLGLTALLAVRARAWQGLAGLWLCYLVLLVPVLGFTEHPHCAYDRYSYIIAILFSVLASAALLQLWERVRLRQAATGLCAVALAVCGLASLEQTKVWSNDGTLMPHIIRVLGDHPSRAKQDLVYGVVLMRNGLQPEAEASFRNAIRFDPSYVDAHANLGDVLADQNKLPEAVAAYRRALELKPDDIHARQGLGVALGGLKQFDEAVAQFKEVLRLDANHANTFHNLALTVNQLGQKELAKSYYERAQTLRREEHIAHVP